MLFHQRVNRKAGDHFICISVCQMAFHRLFRRYFVVIGDTSLKKASAVVSQLYGV
ncbi:conserved hypothetical protein [Escherichia coli FVEC1412]|nr:conserved hypothetical protein [Escherichia coli FVEC1412]EFI21679.1 conserved hypothetical protein [Escherichia coli FVEC1302]